jgi:hypothetical protein
MNGKEKYELQWSGKGNNMKKGKISLCIILIAVLMFGSQVSAASGINAHERRVLNALSQSRTTAAGVALTLPAQYVNQATTYLQRDGVNLTRAQSNEVIDKVNEVVALVTATNATKWSEVPSEVVAQSIKLAQEAASAVGLSLTYDVATKVLTVKDSSGTAVLNSEQVVKQTGYEQSIFWVGGFVILVLATLVYKLKMTRAYTVATQKCAS